MTDKLAVLDVERLAAALVEVEENHLNLACLTDTCDHEDDCPDYAIGCGDAEEIAREYERAAS